MKRESTLHKITSLDMMEVCEVIDYLPDYKSPVVMEYCVNKNLDDINRNI